jgi:hypothetical protein
MKRHEYFLELLRFNYGQSKPEKTVTKTTKTVWR